MLDQQKAVTQIERLVSIHGGHIYSGGYSGRCMFGKKCYGVVTDDPDAIFTASKKVQALREVCRDQLGLSYIVYWPNVGWTETTQK